MPLGNKEQTSRVLINCLTQRTWSVYHTLMNLLKLVVAWLPTVDSACDELYALSAQTHTVMKRRLEESYVGNQG